MAPFWWLLTAAVLVWYSTVTIYVAIRGATDIKNMLARLKVINLEPEEAPEPPRPFEPPTQES